MHYPNKRRTGADVKENTQKQVLDAIHLGQVADGLEILERNGDPATITEANQNSIEPLEPLRDLLRAFGLNPSAATCWRWICKGRRGAKLRVVRANRLLSKKSWMSAFLLAISENVPPVTVATPAELQARHRRALRELSRD